jgi:aminopeptidase N
MKRLFLFCLFAAIAAGSLFAQLNADSRGSAFCFQKKTRMASMPDPANPATGGPVHSFDVLNYKMDLNIYQCFYTPFPKNYNATLVITLKADSLISSITLDCMFSTLVIDAVQLAGVSFNQGGSTLTIQLDRSYNPGEELQIKIIYHHKTTGTSGFYAINGMVFTDCEPEGARYWFPCWDKPSDKATFDLTVKTPAVAKLGSNGILADSVINGDTCTWHWVSNHNVATYLMVISANLNYKLDIVYWHKLSNPNDSIPLRFYYFDGEFPGPMEEILPDMTTYYSENFCEHPFDKNGFASISEGFNWGGMENQTLTSICPNCWYSSLLAHEYAHQWFGDMITCGTWADIFLNEGFATWTEAFWLENTNGYAAYKDDIDGYASYYMGNNPGWAISVPEWATNTPSVNTLFNYAITYCKGASVLHILRNTIGDSAYFATLKSYANDTNLRFRSAVIPDFIAHVNAATGEDYNWFFDEWIYQPNHPLYASIYDFTDLGKGQWRVDLTVTQTQTNTVFFKMPIDLQIHFEDNTDTLIRVMNNENYQSFQWTFNKQPDALFIDPDNNIVLKESVVLLGMQEKNAANGLRLFPNYPNPAKNTTRIAYKIESSCDIQLDIYNVMGSLVKSCFEHSMTAGTHQMDIDCSGMTPGIYFYRIKAGESELTSKLVISK